MSNIYNLEPQAFGLITFKTTFGDLDIELFTKQCPKATRNFIQLCLDGYYNNTIFERVEKDFITVGGASKNSDDKGHKETFPDEFHSRLRFSRRGLMATANTSKNSNGPKFFFTLGPTPELQNKHTIFGRIKGNSIYCLVDLNDCIVDDDYKPCTEQRVEDVVVVENPFPDILPIVSSFKHGPSEVEGDSSDSEDPILKPKSTQYDSKKLSFHHDDEDEDENENHSDDERSTKIDITKQTSSTNERDSCERSIESTTKSRDTKSDDDLENTTDPEEEMNAKEKRLNEIRAQIQIIKDQLPTKTLSERRKLKESLSDEHSSETLDDSGSQVRTLSNKSKNRERETLELLTRFKKRLREASREQKETGCHGDLAMNELTEHDELDKVDGDDWLRHKFEPEDDVRLAKDASNEDDDWQYEKASDGHRRSHTRPKEHSSGRKGELKGRTSKSSHSKEYR